MLRTNPTRRPVALAALSTAVVLAAAPGARADATIFADESAFLAAAGPVSLESFEGLPPDNQFRTRSSVALPGVTISTPLVELSVWSTDAGGAHATDGQQHLQNSGPEGPDPLPRPMVFEFEDPIGAIGFTVTDWGDFFPVGTLTFADDQERLFEVAVAPQDNGSEIFFGMISDEPLSAVALLHDIDGEGYGIDEIYYAPEPGAGAAALAAAAVLLAARRWRAEG